MLEDLLSDPTLRTVAIGAGAIGAVSGALGCFATLRRQALVGDVVSHASLAGIVLAFLASYAWTGTGSKSLVVLVPGAIVAGVAALLLSRLVTTRTRLGEDAGLGVMLAVFFGTGVLLLRWVQRTEPTIPGRTGLEGYLFGLAAAMTRADLVMILALGAAALVVVLLAWKELKVHTFDPLYAQSLGLPAGALDVTVLVLLVLGIVIGIQSVGVVLMIALLVTPASAARQWTRHLGPMLALAAAFGAASGVVGAVVSATTPHTPTGPAIVLAASALFLVSIVAAPRRGVVARARRRRRLAASGRDAA